MVTFNLARERNLKIIISRVCLKEKDTLSKAFSKEEIIKKFYFRRSDLLDIFKTFFEYQGKDKYILKDGIKSEINKYLRENENAKAELSNAIEIFNNNFKNLMDNNKEGYKYQNFQHMYEVVRELLPILHWSYLPIYEEYMFQNGNIIPEDNICEYYNNYHALEDLYKVVNQSYPNLLSYKGDINLDKKLIFKVFTRRWGHYDYYNIQRKVDGWYIDYLSTNGKAKKDGSGAIFKALDHDSVVYPKEGIKYAFSTLWDMADSKEMSVEELQMKLQEIADWISELEKVTDKYQPSWCNYY